MFVGSVRGVMVAVLGTGLAAGCVAPPPVVYQAPVAAAVPQQDAPFVAVPGPGRAQAAFQADDTFCRTPQALTPIRVQQATAAQPGVPPEDLSRLTPGVIYLQCMEARGNTVQPLVQASAPPVYAYYQPYPVYAGPWYGYGYPWYYGSIGFGFGYGFGGYRYGFGGYGYRGFYGYRGGYYGGYRGGYGGYGYGGYRGGYGGYGGGFRGGYGGGGFRGR